MGPGRTEEGLDTLRLLKHLDPDVHVALFSGYAISNRVRQALEFGADIFVEKGTPNSLERIIGNFIQKDQQRFRTSLSNHVDDLSLSGNVETEPLDSELTDFYHSGLVGPDGEPLQQKSSEFIQIITQVQKTNEAIFTKIRNNPDFMGSLTPREFEEFVADLLRKLGYEVQLTPATRDGGFDMYAASKNELGTFLYLVECKKFDFSNKVGVDVIRSLYGVLESKRATAGMVITTSFFTKDARDFQRETMYRIQLHNYLKIRRWLESV